LLTLITEPSSAQEIPLIVALPFKQEVKSVSFAPVHEELISDIALTSASFTQRATKLLSSMYIVLLYLDCTCPDKLIKITLLDFIIVIFLKSSFETVKLCVKVTYSPH